MSVRDKEEVRRIFEEVYPDNVRLADSISSGRMYSEIALWMPPDAPDRQGVDDIVQGFSAQFAHQSIDPIFTAEEIEVMGDFAYVLGTSDATIHPKDYSPDHVVKYRALWLLKKEKESWNITHQIWNKKL